MDLRISIVDENDDVLESCTVYQDGSDSEGAARIIEMIRAEFTGFEEEEDSSE